MKRPDLLHRLTAFSLAALLSLGAVGCLVSAYDFQVTWGSIVGVCLLGAALGAFFCCNRPAMVIGLMVIATALWQLWRGGLAPHTEAVLYYISKLLHQSYGTGYLIYWSDQPPFLQDTTAFFMGSGMLIAFFGSWALSKNRSLPALLSPLPLLIASLPITDMAPKPIWLTVLLCGMLTVYLSRRIRRHNPENSAKLTLRGGVCVLLLLALTWGIFPPSTYEAPDLSAVDQWLTELLTSTNPTAPTVPWLPPVTSPPVIGPGVSGSKQVNLRNVGYNSFSQRYAFRITCTESGWQYLRTQHYGGYDGLSWTQYESEEQFAASSNFLSAQEQSVSFYLYTANAWSQLTPYYSASTLVDGRVPMKNAPSEYTVTYQPLAQDWQARWQQSFGGTIAQQSWGVDEVYLSLPENALEGARVHLANMGLTEDMSVTQVADIIGNYVRGSAKYNLQTPKMPQEQEDFALWFLNDSERGYCIHFASAATVLLRAAGIPARYVEGYLTDTDANVQRMVFQGNAHAWAEYYLPGLGWVILEATPGSTGPEPTNPTPPATEPTPPPTTQPTEPKPTKPTLPPNITTPTEPSIPATQPGPTPEPEIDWTPLWKALKIAGQVALVIAAVIAQWRLRLAWLAHRLHKGNDRQQALARWRHSKWLAKLRREAPPQQLLVLVNKAKFSRDGLSHPELRQFDQYRAASIDALCRRNFLLRFIYRIILAIY